MLGYEDTPMIPDAKGSVVAQAVVDTHKDIAALGALLAAEQECVEGCEILVANCGTKKPLDLMSRLNFISEEMEYSRQIYGLDKDSYEYAQMDNSLRTQLALRFLVSELRDKYEDRHGPWYYIKDDEDD